MPICMRTTVCIYIYFAHSMWSLHAFTSSFPQIWSKDASPLWHKFEWVAETIKLCFSLMFRYLPEKGCIDFRLFVSVFGLVYTCTWLCIHDVLCTACWRECRSAAACSLVRCHHELTSSLHPHTHHIHTHTHTCTPAHLHPHTHCAPTHMYLNLLLTTSNYN